MRRVSASGPSLFGKLPIALDFVRLNHDFPESILLDRWMQTGVQRLSARGLHWPAEPISFVLAAREMQHALLGVVTASRDRAGRRFPVAIYTRVPVGADQGAAATALVSADFTRDTEGLLASIATLALPELTIGLRNLRSPTAGQLLDAERDLTRELAARSLTSFAGPLFPEDAERAALTALTRSRSRRARDGSSFDSFACPVKSLLDVSLWSRWLEQAHAEAVSAVWSLAPGQERSLLAPGTLAERTPLFWATPDKRHAQLCRLDEPATRDSPAAPHAAYSGNTPLATLFAGLVL